MKKLNKEKFLKSEIGICLKVCIKLWDQALADKAKFHATSEWRYDNACYSETIREAQWEVYQLVMRETYGINYQFIRTDEYFGVATEDGFDWLFKVMRKKGEQNG